MNNLPTSHVPRPGGAPHSYSSEESKMDAARLLARRNAEVMALGVGLPIAGAASPILQSCFPNYEPPPLHAAAVAAMPSAVVAARGATPGNAVRPLSRAVASTNGTSTNDAPGLQFAELIENGGIPIQIASCCSQPGSSAPRSGRNMAARLAADGPEFLAVRFPQGFSMSEFVEPVTVSLEADQLDLIQQDEAASATSSLTEDANPKPFVTNRNMRSSGVATAGAQQSENPRVVWKVEDAGHKQLLGRRLGIDPSTYFVMLEKNEQGVIQLLPISSWYGLVNNRQPTRRPVGGSSAAGEVSNSDLAERKRRVAIQEEARADARLRSRLGVATTTEENVWGAASAPGVSLRRNSANYEENVYSEDAGLSRQALKRSKAIFKARRGTVRFDNDDDEGLAGSALHVGVVKRSAVDWDWDGDGKATDDEEDAGVDADDGPNDDDVVKGGGGDFQGSDEETEANLSKFGQQMTTALESQIQQDADDELAQFSDDEEEAEESTAQPAAAGSSSGAAGSGTTHSAVDTGDASAQVGDSGAASSFTSTPRSAKAAAGSSGSDVGTSVSKGSAGSKSGVGHSQKQSGVVRQRVSSTTSSSTGGPGPRVKRQNTGSSAASPSDREASSKTSAGSVAGAESHISAEGVRQRVIRTLNLHGGRMATKEFIQSFNITSNTSELFKLIRAAINDVCEVHTENHSGVDVKILELQAQYQQT